MSGHDKSRAVVLTALMVLSVFATGIAFTGGAVADDRTDDLSIDVTPNNITVGSQSDTVSVEVTNADADNETYSYTVTGPSNGNEVVNATSANAEFSFALDPDSEGDYEVSVTANEDNTTSGESDTATETVTAQYDLSFAPQEVAAGDYQQVVTGAITNDQGEGINGEALSLNDPSGTSVDTSVSDANGQVGFQFRPDETGEYTIANGDITYGAVTVTPTDLTLMSDKSEFTAGNEETVNFTVNNSNGEQVNLSENNIGFNITQNGSDIESGSGTFVDADGDGSNETYRTDIDADQSTNAPVNVTASNNTAEGSTTLDVESTNVETSGADDFTKGVKTGSIQFSSIGPDGNDTDGSDTKFVADGGTVELNFDTDAANEGDTPASVSSDDSVDSNDSAYELEDGESVTVTDADNSSVSATAFAYNDSDKNRSVELDVASQTDNDDDSDGLYGDNTTLTFERLDGQAEQSEIPVTGDSAIDVNATNASGDLFDRPVDLTSSDTGVDRSGNTGNDGQTTFSVNPGQTGTIDLNVNYDDEFVDGDSNAPDSVQTDTVEVTKNVDEKPPANGIITAPAQQDFGTVTGGETTATRGITVTNTGNGPVTVNSTEIVGADKAAYTVVNGEANFSLGAGESQDVSVKFAPGSAGDKTDASLEIGTENDGSRSVNLLGQSKQAGAEMHTLRISGTSDYTFYSFAVPGELSGTTSLTGEDTVEGNTVQGAVGPGADQITFTGDPADLKLYVNNGANVVVDGQQVNPDNYESTLGFEGTGSYSSYDFELRNGAIQSTSGLSGEDDVSNDEASGAVAGSTDRYAFTGAFDGIDRNGDAAVVLNGQSVDLSQLYNTVEFSGDGSYSFTTNGEVKNGAGLTGEDSINGNSASGAVGGGSDSYVYSGSITNINTDDGITVDGSEEDYE